MFKWELTTKNNVRKLDSFQKDRNCQDFFLFLWLNVAFICYRIRKKASWQVLKIGWSLHYSSELHCHWLDSIHLVSVIFTKAVAGTPHSQGPRHWGLSQHWSSFLMCQASSSFILLNLFNKILYITAQNPLPLWKSVIFHNIMPYLNQKTVVNALPDFYWLNHLLNHRYFPPPPQNKTCLI